MSTSSTGTAGGQAGWTPPTIEELQQLLPQYEIGSILGRGGMGAVYKGRQAALQRPVAIKVLPETLISGDNNHQYVERFKLEARAMANLDHPAIISVFDFGQTTVGHLYFVMEFIDGMDIEQYIAASGGQVAPEHAIAIVSHVLDALGYAHSKGIVHRDIKPANVLINSEGKVKIADFGLAKEFGGKAAEAAGLTMTNMAMGTPDYIAPEALELGKTPDHRADLYAVGVMLYKMLTGKLPRGMFKLPSEEIPGLDERFDEIIALAMESDPAGRFQGATQFRGRLDDMLSQPVSRIVPGQDTALVSAPAKIPDFSNSEFANRQESQTFRHQGSSRAPTPQPRRAKGGSSKLFAGITAIVVLIGVVSFALPKLRKQQQETLAKGATAAEPASPGNAGTQFEANASNKKGEPQTIPKSSSVADLDTGANPTADDVPAGNSPEMRPDTTPIKSVRSDDPISKQSSPAANSPAEPESPTNALAEVDPTNSTSASSDLLTIPGLGTRLEGYLATRSTQVGNLANSYLKGLETRLNKAANAGDLSLVEAFREEQARVEELKQNLAKHHADLLSAVAEPTTLPPLAEEAPTELTGLRDVWIEERKKIRSTLDAAIHTSLKSLEVQLTKAREFDHAKKVLSFRDSLVATTLPVAVTPELRIRPGDSFKKSPPLALSSASKATPFENSLGMKFVPIEGTNILMCIHETRKKDYAAYAEENKEIDETWRNPVQDGIPLSERTDHPVAKVNYNEAKAFCNWLSKKEAIPYRLPTEHEWNIAIAYDLPNPHELSEEELANTVMRGKNWEEGEAIDNGNFTHKTNVAVDKDGYSGTAPVMTFDANSRGLYDMAGNVWEWCSGNSKSGDQISVLRGPGLFNWGPVLKTPKRLEMAPETRSPITGKMPPQTPGFRCVITLTTDK